MNQADIALIFLNLPVFIFSIYFAYSLSDKKIKKENYRSILIATFLIIFLFLAEYAVSFVDVYKGIIMHSLLLLFAFFSPFYLRKNAEVLQAFIPVSLLRIINLALPLYGIYIYYQLLLIYSLTFISTISFMLIKRISLRDVGIGGIGFRDMLLGIILGILFGFTEFRVIGRVEILPEFIVSSIGIFFILGMTEELIFRGLLLNALEETGIMPAIFLSSLAFAVMHIIWRSFLEPFFVFYIGFVLAVLRYKKNSLTIPVLIHTVINFILFQVIPFRLHL